MKQHIPNAITLMNLFFGCCSLVSVWQGQYDALILFTCFSLISDFFDGWSARRLNVCSPLGLQLDSLADMVSFGLVPGFIVFKLLNPITSNESLLSNNAFIYVIPAFSICAFSGLRLAKFNIETQDLDNFSGLNTPCNTIFFIGLLLINQNDTWGLASLIQNPTVLTVIALLSSYLLVADIPMFTLKGSMSLTKAIYFLMCLGAFIVFREAVVSISILLYTLINITISLFRKRRIELLKI